MLFLFCSRCSTLDKLESFQLHTNLGLSLQLHATSFRRGISFTLFCCYIVNFTLLFDHFERRILFENNSLFVRANQK